MLTYIFLIKAKVCLTYLENAYRWHSAFQKTVFDDQIQPSGWKIHISWSFTYLFLFHNNISTFASQNKPDKIGWITHLQSDWWNLYILYLLLRHIKQNIFL